MFSPKTSVRSKSPEKFCPVDLDPTTQVNKNQLEKINDNLSKLCESLCGSSDSSDVADLDYLKKLEI